MENIVHSHDLTTMTLGTHDIAIDVDENGIEAEQMGDGVTVKEGLGGSAITSTNSNRTYKITVNLLQDSVANQYLRAYHEATITSGAEFPMDLYLGGTGERITSAFATVTKAPKMASKKEASTKTWEITARRCIVSENDSASSVAISVANTVAGGADKVYNFLA